MTRQCAGHGKTVFLTREEAEATLKGEVIPMLDFSSIKQPTAIKDHRCSLYGGNIHAGEKYIRFSGRYEGEMFKEED